MATDYDTPRTDAEDTDSDSLEALKARRALETQSASVDLDEADLAESLELPGADLSGEELTVRVLPRQADGWSAWTAPREGGPRARRADDPVRRRRRSLPGCHRRTAALAMDRRAMKVLGRRRHPPAPDAGSAAAPGLAQGGGMGDEAA